MDIQIFVYDNTDKSLKAIPYLDNALHLPCVRGSDGDIEQRFVIKNTSNNILSNVALSADVGELTNDTFTSAVSPLYVFPSVSDYNAGLDHTIATILPDETYNLFIRSTHSSYVPTINFVQLSLDITYIKSQIVPTDLLVHYEFTENSKATIALDSYKNIQATVTSALPHKYILRGMGKGYLTSVNDSITFKVDDSEHTSMSAFVKCAISYAEASQSILTTINGNNKMELGLTAERKLYLLVSQEGVSVTIVSDEYLNDTIKEYTIGYSISDDALLVTVDGSEVTMKSTTEYDAISGLNLFNDWKIGGFTGVLSDCLIFNNYQEHAMHKNIYTKL